MSHTARFFDADNDPLFEESLVDRTSGRALFLSYTGLIYPAQLSARPVIEKPWSLQVAAGMPAAGTGVQELAWRPGGLHMIAWHKAKNRLYVLMHMGNHWTAKGTGTEVWVLDISSHALLKRLQLPEPSNSIAVSQDAEPLLYILTKTGDLLTVDLETGLKKKKAEAYAPGARIAWVPGF
jgi:methylamine dehydrogenase heavy chain